LECVLDTCSPYKGNAVVHPDSLPTVFH